jgi:hypothetical protein
MGCYHDYILRPPGGLRNLILKIAIKILMNLFNNNFTKLLKNRNVFFTVEKANCFTINLSWSRSTTLHVPATRRQGFLRFLHLMKADMFYACHSICNVIPCKFLHPLETPPGVSLQIYFFLFIFSNFRIYYFHALNDYQNVIKVHFSC